MAMFPLGTKGPVQRVPAVPGSHLEIPSRPWALLLTSVAGAADTRAEWHIWTIYFRANPPTHQGCSRRRSQFCRGGNFVNFGRKTGDFVT
jgi:hypothetical protein